MAETIAFLQKMTNKNFGIDRGFIPLEVIISNRGKEGFAEKKGWDVIEPVHESF